MDEKPELIVFAENKIGGVQSYYYNLLSNDSQNRFDKLWILADSLVTKDARLIEPFNCCKEIVFTFAPDKLYNIADQLHPLISNRPGVIMTNHELELVALYKYRRKNKMLAFVCHDELYFDNALKYEFLIDLYIAHNPYFFAELKKRLPTTRSKDVYYLPYGITPSAQVREPHLKGTLKILFIARLTEKKGIFDLKKIDDELIKAGVVVEWTIIGDGPDKARLVEDLKGRSHFTFLSPPRNEDILDIAKKNDVYILPSYLDGLPVALLEAMSAGLVPIVSRFNPGIDAVVKIDNGFIVPVGNIHGFAEKIRYLNDNRHELEARSINARLKVLTEYEIDSRAKNYYDLLAQFKKLKKPVVFRRKMHNGKWDYPWIPQFMREILKLRYHLFQFAKGQIKRVPSVNG